MNETPRCNLAALQLAAVRSRSRGGWVSECLWNVDAEEQSSVASPHPAANPRGFRRSICFFFPPQMVCFILYCCDKVILLRLCKCSLFAWVNLRERPLKSLELHLRTLVHKTASQSPRNTAVRAWGRLVSRASSENNISCVKHDTGIASLPQTMGSTPETCRRTHLLHGEAWWWQHHAGRMLFYSRDREADQSCRTVALKEWSCKPWL